MKSHKFKLLSLILGDIIYLASTTIMLNYACPKLSSFELSLLEFIQIIPFSVLVSYTFVNVKNNGEFQTPAWLDKRMKEWLRRRDYRSLISVINWELSKKYSKIFIDVAENGLTINTFENNGKFPPSFVVTGGSVPEFYPVIYVDTNLLKRLDEEEFKLLVLNGLADYQLKSKLKNSKIRSFMPKLSILAILSALVSCVVLIDLNIIGILYLVPLVLIIISVLALLILIYKIKKELKGAGSFALRYSMDKEALLSTLNKIASHIKSSDYGEQWTKNSIKPIERRIKNLNKYKNI